MCLLVEGLSKNLLMEEISHVRHKESSVPVVSHMTSIVDAGHKVAESFPWCVLIDVQVQAQQILWHLTSQQCKHIFLVCTRNTCYPRIKFSWTKVIKMWTPSPPPPKKKKIRNTLTHIFPHKIIPASRFYEKAGAILPMDSIEHLFVWLDTFSHSIHAACLWLS